MIQAKIIETATGRVIKESRHEGISDTKDSVATGLIAWATGEEIARVEDFHVETVGPYGFGGSAA
jgi:hypothetical protein